jgi:hypothetical protein
VAGNLCSAAIAFSEDEYQACSGEQTAIVLIYEDGIAEQAWSDDDGAGVPVIVWGRATMRRAVEPATLAGGIRLSALWRSELRVHGGAPGARVRTLRLPVLGNSGDHLSQDADSAEQLVLGNLLYESRQERYLGNAVG